MATLNTGVGQLGKLWDTATPTALLASDNIFVPASGLGGRKVLVQYEWQVSPAACTFLIQSTPDDPDASTATWATEATFTDTVRGTAVITTQSKYLRAYCSSVTIGSGAGLTVAVTLGTDLRLDKVILDTNAVRESALHYEVSATGTGAADAYGLAVTLTASGVLSYYQTAGYFKLNAAGATGNLRNPVAIQGDMEFTDADCWVQGLGYGIGTYITFPAKACITGTFTGINVEFSIPTGWSGHLTNVIHSMLRMGTSGAGIAEFDTSGYLMEIYGLSAGAGKLFRVAAPTTLAASFRVRVGATTYYLPLYSAAA